MLTDTPCPQPGCEGQLVEELDDENARLVLWCEDCPHVEYGETE